ncbi:MAG: DUF4386 domain-containing protein [Sphingobacteriales bacterium]|nr:MAG: DUF4386 domain-containing protein [Sphingobacteriales bacterium]
MAQNQLNSSPKVYARVGGIAYLVIIIAGIFGEMVVRKTIIVAGDASATTANILAHSQLWRAGIAGDLLMHVCDVIVMVCLYVLLKPVNKNLALLAILFNLVQTSVLVANKMNLLMPLFLSEDVNYLKALDPHQLQAMSYLSVKAHSYGFGIGLIFFGFTCLSYGYLIFKSGFFPKLFGVLMAIAGLCYLLNSFTLILAPKLSNFMMLVPAFIGEFSFCLWLIIAGVNVSKWRERKNMYLINQ